MSREAMAAGLEGRLSRPERIRAWGYEFDPSGLELLRRAIEHVASARPVDGTAPARGGRPDLMRRFHVQRQARDRYGVDGTLLGVRGDLLVTDLAGIRRLSARMNAAREPGAAPVSAGEIAALGLIHEASHLLDRGLRGRAAGRTRWPMRWPPWTRAWVPTPTSSSTGSRTEFPGPGPVPEPPRDRRRGDAAHPGRQREPGPRAAARARGRPRSGPRYALRGSDRAPGIGLLGRSARRRGRRDAARRHARSRPPLPDIAVRAAALHPRPLGRAPGRRPARADRSPRDRHRRPVGGEARPHAAIRRRTRGRSRPGRDPGDRRPRRRGGGVLVRLGVDAAGRPDGQEHVRLARPAVPRATGATSGRSMPSPTRSSTRSPAGA